MERVAARGPAPDFMGRGRGLPLGFLSAEQTGPPWVLHSALSEQVTSASLGGTSYFSGLPSGDGKKGERNDQALPQSQGSQRGGEETSGALSLPRPTPLSRPSLDDVRTMAVGEPV